MKESLGGVSADRASFRAVVYMLNCERRYDLVIFPVHNAFFCDKNRGPDMPKLCDTCQGHLGLGVRFRNIWNRKHGWWEHHRFCSMTCEQAFTNTAVGHLVPQAHLSFLTQISSR
jgi:hypothetical protein